MADSIIQFWEEADPGFFAGNGFIASGVEGQTSAQLLQRFDHKPSIRISATNLGDAK